MLFHSVTMTSNGTREDDIMALTGWLEIRPIYLDVLEKQGVRGRLSSTQQPSFCPSVSSDHWLPEELVKKDLNTIDHTWPPQVESSRSHLRQRYPQPS